MANMMPHFVHCVTTQMLSGKHGISFTAGNSMRMCKKLLEHTAYDVSPLQSDLLRLTAELILIAQSDLPE